MITCSCGATYTAVPVWPLTCRCGKVWTQDMAVTTTRPLVPNPWEVLHSRYAAAILSGVWVPEDEQVWLDTVFQALIPCDACGVKWLSIKGLIDLSTPETALHGSWLAHNTVSGHLVPAKPPISYALCRALYLPQPPLGVVAATSLSPRNLARQLACLATWQQFGLEIHAVQLAAEIEEMRDLYPMVTGWHVADTAPPYIWQLADVACTVGKTALVINADIEIHGEQATLLQALAQGAVIGVRHNYAEQWWINTREEWGLDVFSFTPAMAAILPRLPLRVGRPMWDYWVPHHFKLVGQAVGWVNTPLFYHKLHALNWSKEDWQQGADIFMQHYGIDPQTNWAAYRQGLASA